MSRPIRAGDYVEHFDPQLAHHRAWLQAVLEQLVALDPAALEEGGSLRNFGRRWMVEPIGGEAYRYAPGRGWAVVVGEGAYRRIFM